MSADNPRIIEVRDEFWAELCSLLKPEERWDGHLDRPSLQFWVFPNQEIVFTVRQEKA